MIIIINEHMDLEEVGEGVIRREDLFYASKLWTILLLSLYIKPEYSIIYQGYNNNYEYNIIIS